MSSNIRYSYSFLLSISSSTSTRSPLRSEEHTSELQSPCNLVCRLLLEKKKTPNRMSSTSPCRSSAPSSTLQSARCWRDSILELRTPSRSLSPPPSSAPHPL